MVSIAVGGRWTAFEESAALERVGYLQSLITTYPWPLVKVLHGPSRVSSAPLSLFIRQRTDALPRLGADPEAIATRFSAFAASKVGSGKVIVWAGFGSAFEHHDGVAVQSTSAHPVAEAHLLGLPDDCATTPLARLIHNDCLAAHILIVPSEYARRTYIESGVAAHRVRVVPHGLDLPFWARHSDARSRSTGFTVAVVASQRPIKGLGVLTDALEQLSAPLRLILVGDLPRSHPLNTSTHHRVELVGRRSRRQVRDILTSADLCVVPSLSEGFSLVLLEALACGTPVVATDHSCGPELLGDGGGRCFASGDSVDLAHMIDDIRALRPRAWLETSRVAARTARRYSWTSYPRWLKSAAPELLVSG